MAAEDSSSCRLPVPLLLPLPEVARIPPITITKNGPQKYVISRASPRVTMSPRVAEPDVVSSEPTPLYNLDYVPQPCNYQIRTSGSFVAPTTSSDSYSNFRQSQITNVSSKYKHQSAPVVLRSTPNQVIGHSGSTITNSSSSGGSSSSSSSSSSSCQNDNYAAWYVSTSSSGSAYSSSISDVRRASHSGNISNTMNHGSTISSSPTCTSVVNSIPFSPSVSVDSASYPLNHQASNGWSAYSCPSPSPSLKSVGAHPTFSSGVQESSSNSSGSSSSSNSNHLSKDVAGSSSGSSSNCCTSTSSSSGSYGTIQFVDLTTFTNDPGNGHNLSSSISDGNSRNAALTSLLNSSVNYVDSSQESWKVMTRATPSHTDLQLQPKIKNALAEVTLLMTYIGNEFRKIPNETPSKLEQIVLGTDCMAELQRFNKYSNANPLPTPSQLLPKGAQLFTVCKALCHKYYSMTVQKKNFSAEDERVMHTIKLFLLNLKRLLTLRGENTPAAVVRYESATSSTTPAFGCASWPTDPEFELDLCQPPQSDFSLERMKNYEKILYKTMLDEKKEVEKKLEETKQKCAELEEKLKKKEAIGCWREDNMSEWCCELMSELKTTMLDLMENEFKCCICDELLIQPGITNCQHIFCTFCLNTWREKKKECPVCRAPITNVYKVNAIDEYITAATSSLSDKAYAERLQVIEDRKNTNPPPAKKGNWCALQSSTVTPAPALGLHHPRSSFLLHHHPSPFPHSLSERNSSAWHSPSAVDRFLLGATPIANANATAAAAAAATEHHSFPSSADIPTSGPWSQQNIPLSTGASRRARPSTFYFRSIFSPVVAAEPSDGRSVEPFP